MEASAKHPSTHATPVRYPSVHYVYVLRSLRDGNLYTGYTTDLRQRVADHTAGKAPSTRDRRPLHLIYYEAYLLPKDAKARERFLSGGKHHDRPRETENEKDQVRHRESVGETTERREASIVNRTIPTAPKEARDAPGMPRVNWQGGGAAKFLPG